MRTPEEKEQIVLESLDRGLKKTAAKYDVHSSVLKRWREKYRNFGLGGLKSKTGKGLHPGSGNPLAGLQRKKNSIKEERLEFENLKLKIEAARLKKEYLVKGVGTKKEYVIIKESNTKS